MRQILRPALSLRVFLVVLGLASATIPAAGVVFFMTGGEVAGTLLAAGILILILGPTLFFGFRVALVIDERQISYRSLQPQTVPLAEVQGLAIRKHLSAYYGFDQLLFIGAGGQTLMTAVDVWSDRQIRDLAQQLDIPVTVL